MEGDAAGRSDTARGISLVVGIPAPDIPEWSSPILWPATGPPGPLTLCEFHQAAPLPVDSMNLLLRWVLPPLGLILLAIVVSPIADRLRGPSTREIAEELRDSADLVRPRIDACLSTRSAIELRFEDHVRRTGALSDSIDGLESLDPRGVPVDHYEVYLSLVEQYNRATLEWEGLAGELRDFEPRCRELIGAHNALVDSMARLFPGAADQELLRLPPDTGVPGAGAPGAYGVPEVPGVGVPGVPGTDALP